MRNGRTFVTSININDTHRRKLFYEGSTQFCTRNGWLAASDLFFYMFTQSIKFYTFHYYVLRLQCLKNGIHQIDSKNEWLVLSARFTAKVGLAFVPTLENAFS